MSEGQEELKVLVVDDSAVNRRSITEMLLGLPGVRVVGKAANGEEALRLVRVVEPDVITLDLEMPRMDGFTFLRILMAQHPLPVLVISSYSQKENVFKALEFGAVDFVAKPDLLMPGDRSIRDELVAKISMMRSLCHLKSPEQVAARFSPLPRVLRERQGRAPSRLVVIAASTGGPSALMEIVSALPEHTNLSVLIAQHMPEKFTRTFAERLDRRSRVRVREAEHDDPIVAGQVLICPGMRCLEVLAEGPNDWRVRVVRPAASDRFVPSADRLFQSAAQQVGAATIGIVLTGMADDGAKGALAIREREGYVIAESDQTAVVFGMPRAAIELGAAHQVLALHEIAPFLLSLDTPRAPGPH